MDKSQALLSHSRRRAKQRAGIDLGPVRRRKIVAAIQGGAGTFHSKQSNRVSRWVVSLDGESLMVIYDKSRKQIVTIWRHHTPKGE